MKELKQIMLEKKNWAVAGVTDDTERFGYKIYKKLKEHGYTVYGVNPNLAELEGEKIYKSVKDIEDKVDVLDMVVGPAIAMKTLEEAKEAGIQYIFFQPGSYNDDVIEKAKALDLEYIDEDCIYQTLIDLEENDK